MKTNSERNSMAGLVLHGLSLPYTTIPFSISLRKVQQIRSMTFKVETSILSKWPIKRGKRLPQR